MKTNFNSHYFVRSPSQTQIRLQGVTAPRFDNVNAQNLSPEQFIAEFNRRKEQTRQVVRQAIVAQGQRDKEHLTQVMSEEAMLSLTYVPYVIAEIVWDSAFTVTDMAAALKLSATKKLCRAVKQLRTNYDYERFRVIKPEWRNNETQNMIDFQTQLNDFFNAAASEYSKAILKNTPDLDDGMEYMLRAVYMCRMTIVGLKKYAHAQEKVVENLLNSEINSILPKEIDRLYSLIAEFAGDCQLPHDTENQIQQKHASRLFDLILETGFEREGKTDNKPNSLTPKHQPAMTLEEIRSQIETAYTQFETNHTKFADNGNKAAATRARKATVELEKLFKQYRKASLLSTKKD